MELNGSTSSSNPFARNNPAGQPQQGLVYHQSSSSNPASASAASSSIRPDEQDAALILGLWGGMDVDKAQHTESGGSPFNLFEPQKTDSPSYSNHLLDQMGSGSASRQDGLALGGPLDGDEDQGSSDGEGLDPFEAFQAALGQAPPYQPILSSTSVVGQQSYDLERQNGEEDEGEPELADADKGKGKASPVKPKAARVAKPKPPPKPKVPKTKPKTIVIAEIQIEGVWVPHVKNADGILVPCDKRGDPLPLSSLPTLSGSSIQQNTSNSSTPPPAATASSLRDARLGKRKRNDAVAPPPDTDSNDDQLEEQPAYAKKKVGVKSVKEKKSIAAKEQLRLRKEREKELLNLPKDSSLYAIENFGFGDEGKERALENQAYHELRDAVPALRALYDTYSPFNPLTDVPDPQTGLIDGVPAIQEQNGKITILSTAETYIQHLTKERERIDWEKTALEEFVRKMDGGEAAWKKWRTIFDAQERYLVDSTQGTVLPPPTELPPQPIASSPTTKTFLLSRGAPRFDPLAANSSFDASSSSTSASSLLLPPTIIKPEPVAAEIPSSSSTWTPTTERRESAAPMTPADEAVEKERNEAVKEKNRRKQRMFRERQKAAIQKLEAEIKAVQAATK